MKVTIYGKSNCVWCERARTLAEKRGMKIQYLNLSFVENQTTFLEKFPDARTVPQIILDGEIVGGYQEFVKKVGDHD